MSTNPSSVIVFSAGKPVARQHTLDALRGLAAISVVFIHTVYGSGVSYVPAWMRQLVLMLDVPVFFFLAGWAQALRPSSPRVLSGLLKLYVDYVIFSVCIIMLCIASGSNAWIDIVRAMILQGFRTKDVPIFGESMWFVKVYLAVSLLFYLALTGFQSEIGMRRVRAFFVFVAVAGALFLFQQHVYVAFYFSFLLMGWAFARSGFVLMAPLLVIGVSMIFAISLGIGDLSQRFMSFSKFPPDDFYFLLSLPSIAMCMFAQAMNAKSRMLEWIGKNALWVYFAQGLSGSFIHFLIPANAHDHWKWILGGMFVVNLCGALALAILLRQTIAPVRERCIAWLERMWSARKHVRCAGRNS